MTCFLYLLFYEIEMCIIKWTYHLGHVAKAICFAQNNIYMSLFFYFYFFSDRVCLSLCRKLYINTYKKWLHVLISGLYFVILRNDLKRDIINPYFVYGIKSAVNTFTNNSKVRCSPIVFYYTVLFVGPLFSVHL